MNCGKGLVWEDRSLFCFISLFFDKSTCNLMEVYYN